ncbi:hypothetical protein B0H11DRAFT_1714086 [Mycena galericulata]|nr:hypothetical protein B0H11DRAFT_1714086 [Mycena galericulata]
MGNYSFIPARGSDKRSPCPALNALANHGYISRRGTHIKFTHLLHAVKTVYNLTLPLAFLLTLVGFLTCAKFSLNTPTPEAPSSTKEPLRTSLCRGYRWKFSFSWTLDLADLSARGWNKITHDASLVHASGVPSHAPDPALLANFLSAASRPAPETQTPIGMSLRGLTVVHAARERNLPRPLNTFHEQVALGECALGWLVMHNPDTGAIPLETLAEWFGEERLPKGWWSSKRPVRPIGLWLARRTAGNVQKFMKE